MNENVTTYIKNDVAGIDAKGDFIATCPFIFTGRYQAESTTPSQLRKTAL